MCHLTPPLFQPALWGPQLPVGEDAGPLLLQPLKQFAPVRHGSASNHWRRQPLSASRTARDAAGRAGLSPSLLVGLAPHLPATQCAARRNSSIVGAVGAIASPAGGRSTIATSSCSPADRSQQLNRVQRGVYRCHLRAKDAPPRCVAIAIGSAHRHAANQRRTSGASSRWPCRSIASTRIGTSGLSRFRTPGPMPPDRASASRTASLYMRRPGRSSDRWSGRPARSRRIACLRCKPLPPRIHPKCAPFLPIAQGVTSRQRHHQLVSCRHADLPHVRPRRCTPMGSKLSEATGRLREHSGEAMRPAKLAVAGQGCPSRAKEGGYGGQNVNRRVRPFSDLRVQPANVRYRGRSGLYARRPVRFRRESATRPRSPSPPTGSQRGR